MYSVYAITMFNIHVQLCVSSILDHNLFYFFTPGRTEENIECVEAYMRATKMFRDYSDPSNDPVFSEVG